MTELLDQANNPRASEQLDQGLLQTYLMEQGVIQSPITLIQQFSGGASNLTYRIKTDGNDMILRRPPFGHKAKTAHDMKREVTVLSALGPVLDVCPNALHYCDDESVMGSEFYLMERIEGVIIRRDIPTLLLDRPDMYGLMCKEFASRLVQLHTLNPADVGLADFGKPQGYVSRQVHGWIGRMQSAKTANTLDCDPLTHWLVDRMPDDHAQSAIIHNDYKFDNVIWDEQSLINNEPRMIGVLDWEMTTLGDPFMDLGATLAYWVEEGDPPALIATGMMPTHTPGMLTREEFANAYLHARGWPAQDLSYYRIFGLFRLAVIVQQIFYRYDLGQTDNPRFAPFGDMANLLIHSAQTAARI